MVFLLGSPFEHAVDRARKRRERSPVTLNLDAQSINAATTIAPKAGIAKAPAPLPDPP